MYFEIKQEMVHIPDFRCRIDVLRKKIIYVILYRHADVIEIKSKQPFQYTVLKSGTKEKQCFGACIVTSIDLVEG